MRIENLENAQLSYTREKFDKPLNKHELAIHEFIINDIDKSKLDSMIYGFCINKGECIGFSEEAPL